AALPEPREPNRGSGRAAGARGAFRGCAHRLRLRERSRPESLRVQAPGQGDRPGASGRRHRTGGRRAVSALLEHPLREAGLEATHLVRFYGKWRVVSDVSLGVRRGEVVGLLGPNGAGKTTCFYMIVGLLRPSQGQVLMDGIDITYEPVYRRARTGLGYLAQEPSVFRRLTVRE